MQKLLTFFSAKIFTYTPYLMIKVLMIHQLITSLVLNNWALIGILVLCTASYLGEITTIIILELIDSCV